MYLYMQCKSLEWPRGVKILNFLLTHTKIVTMKVVDERFVIFISTKLLTHGNKKTTNP